MEGNCRNVIGLLFFVLRRKAMKKVLPLVAMALCICALSNAGTCDWIIEVETGTAAEYYDTDIAAGVIDIGEISAPASYEFIVNCNPDEAAVSQVLMGAIGAWTTSAYGLKFEQWNNTGEFGVTAFGVADHYYGVPYILGEDVHVVFVASGGTTELYVNGEWAGSVGAAIAPSGIVGIGYAITAEDGSTTGDVFDGTILGAAVYNSALSAEEIAAHYATIGVNLTAGNPTPANNESLISVDAVLSWDAPVDMTTVGYTVYFGTDPNGDVSYNPQIVFGDDITSIDPGDLDFETTYYWRVDALEPNDVSVTIHQGCAWTFTTAPEIPVLVASPEDVLADIGDSVELTVVGVNQIDYAWYKSVDAANDTPGDDVLQATNAATLVIDDVQPSDEGYYYCVLSNATETEVVSDVARLMTKRLVAHWKLDGTMDDEFGISNGVGFDTEPNYVEGLVDGGQAADFYIEDANAIEVANNDMLTTTEFTVSAWANVAVGSGGTHRALVSNRNEPPQSGFIIYATPGNSWQFWTGSGGWSSIGGPAVVEGEWTHIVATFEATGRNGAAYTGIKKLYVNGELAAESSSQNYVPNEISPLLIGAGENETESHNFFFDGQIDDVQLYSYAMDATEIAYLFSGVTGEWVCVDQPVYDLDGDCVVGLGDLADFANAWLDSGRYPAGL